MSTADGPGLFRRRAGSLGLLAVLVAVLALTLPVSAQTAEPGVSITAGTSPVTEGTAATFTLTRTGATTAELTVSVRVEETGSMLLGTPDTTVTFAVDSDEATLTAATENDAPVEDPSAVTATVTDGAGYQVKADAASATVVVLDDIARLVLNVAPDEVTEGGAAAVTVEITDGVTFAADQTITLTLTGAAAADDFTVYDTAEERLSSPYAITLPANESSAGVYVVTANDADKEPAETIVVAASHGGTAVGAPQTMIIRASPLRLELSSLAVTGPGRDMYPAFDAGILHYAVGCASDSAVTLALSTKETTTRLAVNGIQWANRNARAELPGLAGGDDILITLSNSDGASTTYTVHCLPADFLGVRTEKLPGASAELITVSASNFAAVVDTNGVPRDYYHNHQGLSHFRTQPGDFFVYSFSERVGDIPTFTGGTIRTARQVLLTRDLVKVSTARTIAPLKHTDGHDFVVKENENLVFMAYEPSQRDMSAFNDEEGNPYSTTEGTEDSVIQEVDAQGRQVLLWNSWDHMAIEDCTQHRFPNGYAHINSLQEFDGDIIASFRGCSQVLRIDGTTGEVVWRLGRSNRSDEDWTANGGTPPLKVVDDPYGEFCGQHAARMISPTNLILFDNGVHCVVDPDTGVSQRPGFDFSRVVEYELDLDNNEAVFQRHHSLHGAFSHIALSSGHVEGMPGGNGLASWGWNRRAADSDPTIPDVSVTEIDPHTGKELLTIWLTKPDGTGLFQTRAYPQVFEALEREAPALSAEFPASSQPSVTGLSPTDSQQVVVAFNQPVVDFAARDAIGQRTGRDGQQRQPPRRSGGAGERLHLHPDSSEYRRNHLQPGPRPTLRLGRHLHRGGRLALGDPRALCHQAGTARTPGPRIGIGRGRLAERGLDRAVPYRRL